MLRFLPFFFLHSLCFAETPHARLDALSPIILQWTSDRELGELQGLEMQWSTEENQKRTQILRRDVFSGRRRWLEVQPDQTIRYRFRWIDLETPEAQRGAWSSLRSITSPSTASQVPKAPVLTKAEQTSAFQTTLRWEDRSDNEYGFAVYRCLKGTCNEMARSLPNFHGREVSTVVFGLLPERAYSFEIRAYNAAGESAPSNAIRIFTPPALEPTGAPMDGADLACTSRKQLLSAQEDQPALALSEDRQRLPQGRWGDIYQLTNTQDCHRAGCALQLYGDYGGCYRFLGEFKEIVGRDAQGMPLLFASYSSNAASGTSVLIQPSKRGPVLVSVWDYGAYSQWLAMTGYGWFAPTAKGVQIPHYPQ